MAFEHPGVLPGSVHAAAHPSAEARQLLMYAESCGRFEVTTQYRTSRLAYDNWLLIAVRSGRIACTVGENWTAAGPGSVLLIDCRHPHSYYAMEFSSFSFVHFAGGQTLQLARQIGLHCGQLVNGTHVHGTAERIDAIYELLTRPRLDEYAVSAALYGVMMDVLQDASTGAADDGDRRIALQAQEHIIAHLHEELRVQTLAAAFGYSPSHFTRQFHRVTGYSPYAFVLKARIDRAQQLLIGTGLSIQQIAAQCGFLSQANFSCVFRRQTGMSPTEYRNRMR